MPVETINLLIFLAVPVVMVALLLFAKGARDSDEESDGKANR